MVALSVTHCVVHKDCDSFDSFYSLLYASFAVATRQCSCVLSLCHWDGEVKTCVRFSAVVVGRRGG